MYITKRRLLEYAQAQKINASRVERRCVVLVPTVDDPVHDITRLRAEHGDIWRPDALWVHGVTEESYLTEASSEGIRAFPSGAQNWPDGARFEQRLRLLPFADKSKKLPFQLGICRPFSDVRLWIVGPVREVWLSGWAAVE